MENWLYHLLTEEGMEKVEILNIRIDNVTMDEAYRNILVF